MPLGIIWAAGWGFDRRFFERLLPHFPGVPSLFLDRGYFEDPQDVQKVEEGHWIGIGHSLGFHRLLKLPLAEYVSLAGFNRFCSQLPSQAGTPLRTVDRMIQAYHRNPEQVLQDFYERCTYPGEPPAIKDSERLFSDLQSLKTLDEMKAVQSIHRPILNLAARDDQIVGEALTHEFFQQQQNGQLIFHDKGGHALGFREAGWCAQQIKMWVKSKKR